MNIRRLNALIKNGESTGDLNSQSNNNQNNLNKTKKGPYYNPSSKYCDEIKIANSSKISNFNSSSSNIKVEENNI